MPTFLLAWNPRRWNEWEGGLVQLAGRTALGRPVDVQWSAGSTQRIEPGDRVFLLRTGEDPRGIVGAGRATSAVRKQPHWDPELRERGALSNVVDVRFERLLDPDAERPLDVRAHEALAEIPSTPAVSGFQLGAEAAAVLERLWSEHLGVVGFDADLAEAAHADHYTEGWRRTVVVNLIERNPAARRACIARWGAVCVACEVDMGARYGPIAEGLIHVHHLDPIANSGGIRPVDPCEDLRPVCPNCHAVIHRQSPPLSIDQVRLLLSSQRV